MNVTGISKLLIMTKTATPSKDGDNMYYKLGVVSGTECGMISCNKEIYDAVEQAKTYEFETAFNDQYKTFRLSRLLGACK